MRNRLLLLASLIALATPAVARAQAVISNGKVALGVDAGGSLNVPIPITGCHGGNGGTCGVGLLNTITGNESTYEGCPCEGWGAGVSGGGFGGTWGGANAFYDGFGNVGGSGAPSVVSFVNSATTATSVVDIDGLLSVTHFYHPSSVLDLYQVDVTLTNTSGAALGVGSDGIRYRRLMDWDIDPTAMSEYSTINGNGATNLLGTGDDGFQSSDPFQGRFSPASANCPAFPIDADFYHGGPCDHGALFDFGFSALGIGQSRSFTIFYGVAVNEAQALADLIIVGADNVYSFGQADCKPRGAGNIGDDPCVALEETFIFAFQGVGGATLGTPEPTSGALAATGLIALGALSRRRRRRRRRR